VARYINSSDDAVWDFLTRQSAEPGDAIEVPPDQEDAFENHPIWKPVVSLADLGKRPDPPAPPAPDQQPPAGNDSPPSDQSDTNTEAN
jgi:hypothetical protein